MDQSENLGEKVILYYDLWCLRTSWAENPELGGKILSWAENQGELGVNPLRQD